MKHFKQVAEDLDAAPLLAAIERQPELWEAITMRQDYPGSAHKDTKAIYLRWSEDQSPAAAFHDTDTIPYPAVHLLPEAIPLVDGLATHLDALRLGRVMIVALKPGGIITPHRDEGAYARYYERFHISLLSDDGNLFTCGDETIHMEAGTAWTFDHHKEHSVVNDSERERIHLIMDAVAPAWRFH